MGGVERWVVGSGKLSDTMGPILCQRSRQWPQNHTTRHSRPSDNSHGQLGVASHQCYLKKTTKHCHSVFRALQGYLWLFYCGVWMSVAIQLINKRISILVCTWSIFPDLVTINNQLHLYISNNYTKSYLLYFVCHKMLSWYSYETVVSSYRMLQ